MLTIANSKKKRLQSKCGKVLTHETALKWSAIEENHCKTNWIKQWNWKRNKKLRSKDAVEYKSEAIITGEGGRGKPIKREEKEIKQCFWVEVQKNSKHQTTKFYLYKLLLSDKILFKKFKLGNYSFSDTYDYDEEYMSS